MRVWPGQPYPIGATWTGIGVNFAFFSSNATPMELCLSLDSHTRHRRLSDQADVAGGRRGLQVLP